jgi:glycine oxidase
LMDFKRGYGMIAIIGGGIIGLSIGWYLVRAGRQVTLFEQGQVGQGASWAAAGMLTPWGDNSPNGPAMLGLQLASHDMWPDFERELSAIIDAPVGFRTEGRLMVCLDHEGATELRANYDYNTGHGIKAEWLTGEEVRRLEAHLSPTVTDAVYLPEGYQIDNRRLTKALQTAFLQAGGVLRDKMTVEQVVIENNQVVAIKAEGQRVAAETIIIAAGAWAGQIPGIPVPLPLHAVKGQMLAVQMPAEAPFLRHVVTGLVHLIPRLDGRLLIGATEEPHHDDLSVTAGGIYTLLGGARQMLPAINPLAIMETWSGLRPAATDGLPIIGKTAVDGLVVATGHFRNGILLAPVTARAISRLILSGTTDPSLTPFSPARFK